MKRAIAAVGLTIVGLYLVVSFRSTPVKAHLVAAAPTPTTRASTRTQPETTNAPVATAPPAEALRSVGGPAITMQYGTVQVTLTMRGRTITDVATPQMPYDRPRSVYISQTVAPWLKDEVLKAQSAQIDSISGATYTSEAYIQSLQGALDKANA